ncbi:MAG TPA: hypothetical protein VMD05_05215, partial [Candidatus Nanoarchaeia archaeon]|nr:hypothetical protein [Candidatus Nanoarchaeia archaeon]
MNEKNGLPARHLGLHVFVMVASLFVVYMVGQYARYFSTNKVVAPIQVSGNFGIDIMGALIPVTI